MANFADGKNIKFTIPTLSRRSLVPRPAFVACSTKSEA